MGALVVSVRVHQVLSPPHLRRFVQGGQRGRGNKQQTLPPRPLHTVQYMRVRVRTRTVCFFSKFSVFRPLNTKAASQKTQSDREKTKGREKKDIFRAREWLNNFTRSIIKENE